MDYVDAKNGNKPFQDLSSPKMTTETKMMYCCTYGRGLQDIVCNEMKQILLDCEFVMITEGKVVFNTCFAEKTSKLRTVEKLMLVIGYLPPCKPGDKQPGFPVDHSDMVELVNNNWLLVKSRVVSLLDMKVELFDKILAPQLKSSKRELKRRFVDESNRKITGRASTFQAETGAAHDEHSMFRVSVKLTGLYRKFSNDQIAAEVTKHLVQLLSEESIVSDLSDEAGVVFSLTFSENSVMFGLPVSQQPLSYRPYLFTHGLRPTICAALVQTVELKSGDVVLDPMVGEGTILLEAAFSHHDVTLVGGDVSQEQLIKSTRNIDYMSQILHRDVSIQLLHYDILQGVPMRNHTVDAVITDVPFDRNHKVASVSCISTFYERCLAEFHRLLKPNGHCAILMPASCSASLFNLAEKSGFLIRGTRLVSLGHTSAMIVSLYVKP